MILKFLISVSCYAQPHAFSSNFLQIFLMTFFLVAKLFSHISCKKALKPINIYYILHPPYTKILFHSQYGGKMAYLDYGGCDYGEYDYGGFYGECDYGECEYGECEYGGCEYGE